MERGKKYIKRSADGRYFVYIEKPEYIIDKEKKTKLWLSSPFLFSEAFDDNPIEAEKTLNALIEWNEESQDFESCSKLLNLKRSFQNNSKPLN
jgi:hypothetical protein